MKKIQIIIKIQKTISENNRTQIINDFFGISETSSKNNIFNSSNNRSLNEENHLSSILLLPKPINNNHDNIPNFNNRKQLIINKQILIMKI